MLRGDLEALIADRTLAYAEKAWCHVVLTDPLRPVGAMDRLRRRFPHALKLEFQPSGPTPSSTAYSVRAMQARPELDVCCDFLAHVRGGTPATAQERAVLADAVEQSRVTRGVRADEGVA